MLSLDRGQLRHCHFLRCHVKYYSPIGCSIDCCLILTILVILRLITSVIQLGNHDETKLRISFKYFSEMDTNNEKISGDDNVENMKRSLTEEIKCAWCYKILENSVVIKDIDDENVKLYTLQCTKLTETSLICKSHIAIFI